jgi:hypothetical protein
VTADLGIVTAAAWLVAEDTTAEPVMPPRQTAAPMAAITRLTDQVEVEFFTFITTFRVYFGAFSCAARKLNDPCHRPVICPGRRADRVLSDATQQQRITSLESMESSACTITRTLPRATARLRRVSGRCADNENTYADTRRHVR